MPDATAGSSLVAAFTELVLEVFRLNGQLLATGDRLSAPHGLTSARWQVLGAIDQTPLTVSEIGRAMGLTRQSVQRTVDLLATEGLVTLMPNPNHKRARLVGFTPDGRKRFDQITAVQRAWARETAAGLSAENLAVATRLLQTLRQRLEHATDEPNSLAPLESPSNHGVAP